jgi:hypothetical protein
MLLARKGSKLWACHYFHLCPFAGDTTGTTADVASGSRTSIIEFSMSFCLRSNHGLFAFRPAGKRSYTHGPRQTDRLQ